MVRVSGLSTSAVNRRFWCPAILTAAGAIGTISSADAALYYWQDSEPGFYRPERSSQAHRQKVRHSGKKEAAEKEAAAKPQGPLIISVSINKQQVKIYDANGVFAEAPVSTGMPGHSTPMGVFSVIQKHKLHHSNIYSNAPMPYMQRITWSGVALHAGVLPGYPASHGCIRMPTGFAVKMWNWTKMGARVIVTPGEMTPASFAHPLLPSLKVAPQPVAVEEPHTDASAAAKADKGALETKPPTAATSLELRSTVGHSNVVTPIADVTLRDQTHTANAADAKIMVTMSDAPSGNNAPSREDHAAEADNVKADGVKADAANTEGAPSTTDSATVDVAKIGETATSEPKPAAITESKPATADASDKAAETKTAETRTAEPKPKPEAAKIEPTKDVAKSTEKPNETVKAAGDTSAGAPDGKKDQTRLTKPERPKRTGQIAVFISRKAVTIAPSDRPLGTHIFTAEVDKNDTNALHWSVVSLPVSVRSVMRGDNEERGLRRRKNAAADAKPLQMPASAAEALDRISIPADTMARVSEALTTGASIIVSDQGINQGETGEGTDFIVSLH